MPADDGEAAGMTAASTEAAATMRRGDRVDAGHARRAYEALADRYDAFTAHHDHDDWTATLERLARRCGLEGARMLDVACGTGNSFLPFLARGYEVTACDVSPAMARLATRKASDRATVLVHDMRRLPMLGAFDLVCCVDDALNYLLSTDELDAALAGLARNLAAGGVAVFDVNTVRSYRTFFASMNVSQSQDAVVVWDGHAAPSFGAGEAARATVEIFERGCDGAWTRRCSVHHQRHHPREAIVSSLQRAGLRCAAVYGMRLDGTVAEGFCEDENSKAVYIACHASPNEERR